MDPNGGEETKKSWISADKSVIETWDCEEQVFVIFPAEDSDDSCHSHDARISILDFLINFLKNFYQNEAAKRLLKITVLIFLNYLLSLNEKPRSGFF